MGEDARTAVRQIRREANDEVKQLEKNGEVSEDDMRRALDDIQKATDRHTTLIDHLCKSKETELMEV
jgi:ribosome recycling factor